MGFLCQQLSVSENGAVKRRALLQGQQRPPLLLKTWFLGPGRLAELSDAVARVPLLLLRARSKFGRINTAQPRGPRLAFRFQLQGGNKLESIQAVLFGGKSFLL